MTESEICNSFRGCADRVMQIGIIRDLSLLPKIKILDILIENGLVKSTDPDFDKLVSYCNRGKKPKDESDVAKKSTKSTKSSTKTQSKATTKPMNIADKTRDTLKKPAGNIIKAPKTEAAVPAMAPVSMPKSEPKASEHKSVSILDGKMNIMNSSDVIKFIASQRSIGISYKEIASVLGTTEAAIIRICEKAGIDKEPVFVSEQYRAIAIKRLTELSNYMDYIEAYIQCGRISDIPKILAEQKKLISEVKMYLKM